MSRRDVRHVGSREYATPFEYECVADMLPGDMITALEAEEAILEAFRRGHAAGLEDGVYNVENEWP